MTRYLYLEKKQRVETENELSKRALRIVEELDRMKASFQISHFDDVTLNYTPAGIEIKVAGENILEFTHIVFGGHHLHGSMYEIKRIIVDLVDEWNVKNPDRQIKVQNSEVIKKMVYYDKLYMAKMLLEADLPQLVTYYSASGDYKDNRGPIEYPLIVKHVNGENDLVPIDGKLQVKKNVFLVKDESDWDQERLVDKDVSEFFIQEFAPSGEDYRIFVTKHGIVGGWRRIAQGDNFMTVAKGSEYKYYNEPSDEITQICQKAIKTWGGDFMAIDFIMKEDRPNILEFSLHPGFSAYENKCEDGEPANIAEAILHPANFPG